MIVYKTNESAQKNRVFSGGIGVTLVQNKRILKQLKRFPIAFHLFKVLMYPSIFAKQSAKNALTATKVQKKKTKNILLEKSKADKVKAGKVQTAAGKRKADKLTAEKAQGDKAQKSTKRRAEQRRGQFSTRPVKHKL